MQNKFENPHKKQNVIQKGEWTQSKKDVAEARLQFFQNGELLRQITTNIVLISKVLVPENASHILTYLFPRES